jgi:hypothetical protein
MLEKEGKGEKDFSSLPYIIGLLLELNIIETDNPRKNASSHLQIVFIIYFFSTRVDLNSSTANCFKRFYRQYIDVITHDCTFHIIVSCIMHNI